MKLSKFIIINMEPILQGWESFAKTIPNFGKELDIKQLRDHAKAMLLDIVKCKAPIFKTDQK